MELTPEQQERLNTLALPLIDEFKTLRVKECETYQTDDADYDKRLDTCARSIARAVLRAAEVDGCGGCLLCQS